MNPDPLDDLLTDYSKQSMPPPRQGTSDIWREIEHRRRRPFWNGLLPTLNWNEFFREPRLVISALVLALMAGVLPAVMVRADVSPQLARESLHFDVFSTHSPGAPSALLAFHGVERSPRSQP